MDTIQNACYAVRIMKAHGWRSAEVVSSASHLPRAGIIFSELPLEWRTHAAPPLEPESAAYPWAIGVRRKPEDRALPDLGALERALRALTENCSPACRCPLPVSSCKLNTMRISVRFSAALAVVAALGFVFRNPRPGAKHASPTAGNGTYIASDPLAGVRYDNRYRSFAGHGLRPHEGWSECVARL